MDRLSASGAIAGSKEPWTCRADATPRRRPGNRPGGLRAAGSRAVASARRAAAFPVLCAMLAAPLLGAGGSAQAEELVSNIVVSSATSTAIKLGTATDSKDGVQLFTTGTNAGGYTLTSIELELYTGHGTDHASPTVKLHNVTVSGTSVTLVGTPVATLTASEASVGTASDIYETFMAPMGTALVRSTTYGVFVEGGGSDIFWSQSATSDEDATPAAGWSIGDQAATRAHDGTAGFTLGTGGPGLIRVNGEATISTNNAPTGADKRVVTNEDEDYTFSSADFTFTDTDTGDSLASVKIVTLPASGTGTLTLSGTAIPSTDLPKTVPAADLGNLKYSPPANANVGMIGDFVTFDFKVNDGTDDSADTYTMSIDVAPMNDPVTGKPGITGTAQVGRTLTATVGTIADVDGVPNPFFSAATTTVQWIQVDGGNETDISGATSETYAVATADEGKKIKVKVSFEDDDGTVEGPLTSDAYPSSGTVMGAVNAAPTGADKTLTIASETAYTLTAEDFGFADVNVGDTLHSVRIETLPAAGALELDSAVVSQSDVVTKADIDASKLAFTPTSGASGDSYANFTFKVNDGTVFSDSANTITFNVIDTSCAAPSFGSRRNHWSGAMTVGVLQSGVTVVGYGFEDNFGVGSLAPNFFTIGSNSYTIEAAFFGNAAFDLLGTGSDGLRLDLASAVTSAEAAALEVHVCDSDGFGFSDTDDPVTSLHDYTWQWDGSDWSPPVMTRTLYLSLPANRAATGEPAISGTATAGQVLTATTGTIADADGLPSSFTYQWLRVDADGTSDEEDISGEIAATYTLTDDDEGKKIKVQVSFTDNLSGEEERTSAAYPTSGTVQAGSTPVSTALVSNVEQPGGAHQTLEDNDYAQSFTTGTNATGYTLTSIELRLNSESSTDTPTVKLHSGSANGTEVATLTGPAMLDADTTKNYAFTRTPNVTVRMSTTFAVVVEGDTNWSFALGAGEDATPAAGWVISNDKEFREADSTGSFTVTSGFPFQIRVNGTLGGIVLSSDATLSALALENAADDSAITISPVFAAGTTSYTASVVNGVDEITINPTVNESHATVEYLDSSDTAITDADSTKTGQQVSLTEGANTIKVKVTAEDTTTNTYTVVVTRAATNTAPTAANNTVTTGEDRAYTFTADDFGFMDADTGDTLASVKIVTVPALGTLTFDRTGTAVTANDVVTKAQIDGDNMLTFTPARDAHGAPYTTFTFKVNDGTVDSADAYTMTIDVTDAPAPVCTAPSYGDRREIWTGTVTVAALETDGIVTSYGFDEVRSAGTLLPSQSFSIGSNDYMIEALELSLAGILFFSLDGLEQLTDREDVALRLHVCDGDYDFNTANERFDVTTTTWLTTLDWSDPVVTRTVYLSLPANTAATGEPAITGTARAEQVLTADASPIMDTDGLPSSFTYQWVRVDADGTSNPVDITDANAETYTLTAADVVKKVKVKVSFTDELSGEEERTSAAYPSSGTVTAAGTNTAPTAANNTVTTGEDRAYAFTADDFGFDDTDTGDTLASVKIVTTPALGTLALDDTAVLADDVVTKAQIDADMLTFTPAQDAHGDAYTTFTFKVNDGTVDSADAYTMTIDVTDAPAPVCAAPSFGTRRQIWTGVVTVEEFSFLGSVTGYGFESPSIGISSLLPSAEFSIGSNTYTIVGISVGNNGHLLFSLPSIRLTATERAALRLNVCDEDLDFSVALNEMDSSIYGWEATFDWSDPVVTRTLYLSLPANNGATGEPTISGTAQAGQVLTADASPILDTDGLTGVDFTYQWVRVDADGMSNPADITDATAATYTLTAADAGKKVKVQVSFTDELSGEEERTSAAYPSSGTVIASANTTAPELTSVTVTSTPRKTTDTYGAREHIEFTMTFDAPVTVTGDPTFDFDLGGPSTASWYAGSGTTTLRFSHAVSGGSSGDQDTNGISWAMNAIELNGGTIAGTDNAVTAILTHAAQSNLAGHKVDGRTTAVTPATVTDVVVTSTPMSMASGSSTADTYGFGETIVITVTASEAVEVVGDPEFEFSLSDMGGPANDVPATYDRTRSSPTTIVFTYTVQAGDRDNNGIWIGNHSRTFMLDANDRIRTASQQIDIDRSHPEKSTHTGHKVDGSLGAPTVPPDPTAPTLVSATATTLTIEWTHPGNGGSPLTRNFVHYRVEGTTDWTNWYAGEMPVTRAVITNLEAATAYDVRVHSSNAIGNSQWAQSATAFSTLGGGTASCPAPTFTGRRKIWTGVLTMGDFAELFPANSFRGYDSNPESGDGGGLDPVTFTLGLYDYEIGRIALLTSGGNRLYFLAGEGDGVWWDSTVDALRLHVCNTPYDFSDSFYIYDAESEEDRIESNHRWDTDLDWSGVTTRTVHMSLPLNRAATGAPLITGQATVGQELAVDVTGIEDEDGLHDIEYTYQWVRVDADDTSNEEDITDETDATYTLTDDDLGKKVKIEVSFADDFGSDEQRTSAPTDTVTGLNSAPVFSQTTPARSIAENTAAGQNVGAAVTATDADAGDTLGYTLGGADMASFDFVGTTGQIRTKSGVSYDFEAKSSYTVTVTATDNSNATAVATVTISVTDVDEPPSAPATPMVSAVSGSTTSLSVSWAAPANAGKPAIESYDVQYRAGSSGDWSDGPEDVATTTATITSLTANTLYQARVRATNAEGDSGWSDPPGSGRTNTLTNNAPVFDPAMPEREIAENTAAGVNVGAPVTATDADAGDTLSYTLGGADVASFDFVETTGQIRTKAGVSYDHEAKSSYTVTVTASDGTATADASVTIGITDVDEPPSAPATPAVSAVSGSSTSLSVSWAAPANAGKPAIASYDVQYRAGTSGSWSDGPENVAATTATVTGLVADTLYEARVRATNAEGDSGWSSPPGSGRTNAPSTSAPGAPRDLGTAPGDGRVTLAWTAPGSDGGAAIEKYRYRVSANAGSSWDPDWTDVPDGADAGDGAADETTFTVSGLINGTEYVFQLRAVNSVGEGPAASAADTPVRAPLPPGSGFLVGNFGQPADRVASIFVTQDIVGVFTTGARGAELHNIEFRFFTRLPNIAVLPIPSVTLYRASVTDSRATRGARVAALTVAPGSPGSPGSPLPAEVNTAQTVAFAAPSGTRLEAGATYLVVLERAFPVSVESTTYPAEDAGGAHGWAIDGIGAGNNSPYSYRTTASLLMRVNGTLVGATVATAPDAPASLGAAAGNGRVSLIWTPPRSDGGAGIEKYQVRYSAGSRVDPETGWTDVPDGSDTGTSLADERSVSVTGLDNGRQYAFELRAVNRVRAGAGATARATPAAPPRSGFLVSNFGQPVDGAAQIYVTKDIVGVFTTGARGGALDSIELRLDSRTPEVAQHPSATLYRGSVTGTRATPGTRVATLTAKPGSPRPAASAETITFTAPGGTRLDAGATYMVVLEASSGYVGVQYTNASAQDAGGASGWTIDGVGAGNSSPYSYGTSDSLLMSVNGTTASAQRAVRAVARQDETGQDEAGQDEEEQEEQEPDREISLSTSSSSAIEGGAVTIRVRRTGPTDGATSVAVQVFDSALTDAWPINLRFRSGEATATAEVAIGFDGARPASRTVTVSLASVKAPYSVGSPSSVTFNVTDRDAALSVHDASVNEGPGATLVFTVTLDRKRDRTVLVRYATADGTATQGEDYTGVSGTLRFAPGETSKTVSVAVLDDAHDEGSETLTLTLSAAHRAVIDDATAVGTIVNSDPMPDAWLSRFGRAASDQVVQSIGRRLEGGERESHVTVMGWRVDTLFESSQADRDAPGSQTDGSVRAPDARIGAPSAMTAGTRGAGAMPGPGAAAAAFDGAMTQGSSPIQGGGFQNPAGASPAGASPAGASPAAGAGGNRWLGLMERLLMSLGPNGGEAIGTPGLRDMVKGSSFYYGLSPDAGPLRGMNRLTAWGESASTRFSGAEDKLSLDGEVNTAIAGADGEWGRWLAGLALSYSEGEGGYRQASAKGGAVSSTLSGINPYARYRLNERASFWGTLGYGSGRLTLTPDGAESSLQTDMTNAMAAFGGRGVLSMRTGEAGRFELAVRSDAMLTDTVSDAVLGLAAGEGATSRVRLILEGSGSVPAFGGVLAPTVEAGLRYDGGDAETGAGLEVGGGLAYDKARLTVQVDGRVLLTHRDRDYEEWGYSLSFAYQPGKDGRGLRYQAGSQWGATQSGVQSLWSLQNAGGLANGARTADGQRYTAELGYGFGERRLWYPYVATESGGASSPALRFGLKLNAGSALEAGVEIGRRPHMSGQIENDIQLRWSARW